MRPNTLPLMMLALIAQGCSAMPRTVLAVTSDKLFKPGNVTDRPPTWEALAPASIETQPSADLPSPGTSVAPPTVTTAAPITAAPTLPDRGQPTISPAVPSLPARVNVGLLSCRYGPGPNYLFLYALRQDANIKLIGRIDSASWHWAWVEDQNPCWVNTNYLTYEGDWRQLPIVYPGAAGLPISPYYPPTGIRSVTRSGTAVTVEWFEIPLRPGDEEDEFMQHYILETWLCRNGSLVFEPMATNAAQLTVIDEPGCSTASHARLFLQEKHGFSGPTDVPWPAAH